MVYFSTINGAMAVRVRRSRHLFSLYRRESFHGAEILALEGATVIALCDCWFDTVTVAPVAVELGLKTTILPGMHTNEIPVGTLWIAPSLTAPGLR